MRILIDMDEVMADAVSRFFEWYERDFGIHYTSEQIAGTKLSAVVPDEHKAKVQSYPHTRGFFENLPVIENSREMIQKMNDRYDIYIVSAAMEFKHSLFEKYEWLDEHFPFIHWKRRIFCGDKHLVKGDVLIDDHDFNLSTFEGRAVMFTSPHNIHETRYERMDNWLEADKLFDLERF